MYNFLAINNSLFGKEDLDIYEVLLLSFFEELKRGGNKYNPSLGRIVDRFGGKMSLRTIQRKLDGLEEKGYITRVSGQCDHTTSIYRLVKCSQTEPQAMATESIGYSQPDYRTMDTESIVTMVTESHYKEAYKEKAKKGIKEVINNTVNDSSVEVNSKEALPKPFDISCLELDGDMFDDEPEYQNEYISNNSLLSEYARVMGR